MCIRDREWRAKGEAAPVNAKTRLFAGKVLMTVFWDAKGVVYVDFLLEQRTINAAYYSELLGKVREAYRSKRRKIPIRSVLILHDNAAAATQAKLEELHCTALDHPSYIPDLSPCNYHLLLLCELSLKFQNHDLTILLWTLNK